ncbi:MAG: Crp/Fnr family transcriptional regulator [Desulfovibrionaceae bacterium]|nr:Crp/Fnr family transcriptional regulator [Desulfovibrionaceae bacterium]MBF0515296.1 Crp/Fnr family transcriptional regulator [Desulfovibrionaceae bacterium]
MNKPSKLSLIQLFQGLPADQLAAVEQVAGAKTYERGQEIFSQGDPAGGFFAVVSGRVKIYKSSAAGKEFILHVFGPGEAFAEVPVFSGGDYPASASALETSELLFFPRASLRALIARLPDLAMNMLGLLSGRLRDFNRTIENLSLKEVPARLAAHLLLLHESTGADAFKLDLPKGHLASYLGTTPETLSRILKKMDDLKLIAMAGHRITILDGQGLEALATGLEKFA